MRWNIVTAIGVLVSVCALEDTPVSAGEPSFEFLRQEVGARPAALGGAFSSVLGDVHAVFYNPAGLGGIGTPRGTITYTDQLLDFWTLVGAVAYPIADYGTLAFGLHYLSYGDFQGRDQFGNQSGTFSASDFSLTSSFGRDFTRNVHGGIGVKYIRSGIGGYSSDAVAFDIGGLYRVDKIDLNISIAVMNLGKQRKSFIETSEDLPGHFKIGASKGMAHAPFTIIGEFRRYNDSDMQMMGGIEVSIKDMGQVRVGYNSLGKDQKFGISRDNLAGFSFGGGLQYRKLMFDYTMSVVGGIGVQNSFTFSSFF